MRHLLITLCLLLSACGSTPATRFYLLQATAPATKAVTGLSLGVGPITVPKYLTRPQMMTSGGGHALRYSDYQRWAEPVDNAILRVLTENLARHTGSPQVVAFPWRRDEQPTLTVRIEVLSLDSNRDGDAELRAQWRLLDRVQGQVVARDTTHLITALGTGPANQASAYSELLNQLSAEISAEISRYRPPE